MIEFRIGHATHPDWRAALVLAATQLDAGSLAQEASPSGPPSLGFVYFTEPYAPHATALLAALRERWPGTSWVGSVGVGVCATGVEYTDEPALVLMLTNLPRARFEVFSGVSKLQHIEAWTALVHADPRTPDLGELIDELRDRTGSGYLFGGLSAAQGTAVHVADGVWQGGLSGVAFTRDVALVSRVTQGSQPLGPTRTITACERNIVTALDGQPALPCLLADLGLTSLDDPRLLLPRLRATLVGLTDAHDMALARPGQFGADTRVRHLIGLDPAQQAVAVGDHLRAGMKLAFCERDVAAARRDLVRICSEIREELEAPSEATLPTASAAAGVGAAAAADPALRMKGAIYISCAGRGGAHFGGPSAELRIVQHALGDVPLVGFFAAGEIARHHVYGYTGVLTVFTGAA